MAIPIAALSSSWLRLAKPRQRSSFSCQPDGSTPKAGLLPATRTGNLYGTTSGGGTSNFGTVFEVNANTGMEAVLYSFTGGADGATPVGGLITDQAGNLYGTTTAGGNVTMALVTESCSSSTLQCAKRPCYTRLLA